MARFSSAGKRFAGGRGRGSYHGSGTKELLSIDVTELTSLSLRLRVDSGALIDHVGRELAKLAKRNLRAGRTITGEAMPLAKDGEPALKESGRLINSIQWKYGMVAPTGGVSRVRSRLVGPGEKSRGDDSRTGISKRASGHFGLMAIHVSQGVNGKLIKPMGDGPDDPKLLAIMVKLAEAEIARQVASGRIGLVDELERAATGKRFRRRKQ